MTSLLTNVSAMTALKTLSATNKSIETTQARISTGLEVGQASDNAAYWSIATTMRSDNKALGTVQDALGLGAASVDVAYTAMDASKDVLDDIKTKLVAARQPGVDRSKIQSEIDQLEEQLQGIASAATFAGNNWLSVDSGSSDYKATEQIVSSFSRDAGGELSIGTVDIDVAGIALFDAGGAGLLEGDPLDNIGGLDTQVSSTPVNIGVSGASVGFAPFTAFTLDSDDSIRFDLSLNGSGPTTVEVTKQNVDSALSSTDGVIATKGDYGWVLVDAIEDAGFTNGVDFQTVWGGSGLEIQSMVTTASSEVTVTNMESSQTGTYSTAIGFDVTNATDTQLDTYISNIDAVSQRVTSAAADLGAIKSRIDMQSDFAGSLMDAIDRGVGQLVDADMSQESTRLQALQVQQQLGIQSLSIANSNSQTILSLFR